MPEELDRAACRFGEFLIKIVYTHNYHLEMQELMFRVNWRRYKPMQDKDNNVLSFAIASGLRKCRNI